MSSNNNLNILAVSSQDLKNPKETNYLKFSPARLQAVQKFLHPPVVKKSPGLQLVLDSKRFNDFEFTREIFINNVGHITSKTPLFDSERAVIQSLSSLFTTLDVNDYKSSAYLYLRVSSLLSNHKGMWFNLVICDDPEGEPHPFTECCISDFALWTETCFRDSPYLYETKRAPKRLRSDTNHYKEDLTTEGVEPNPGPKLSKVVKKQAKAMEKEEKQEKKMNKSVKRLITRPTTPGFKGRGDYADDAVNAVGSALKGPVTGALRSVGGWLGSKLGSLFGSGDYSIAQSHVESGNSVAGDVPDRNSLISASPPYIHNLGRKFVMRKREYVGDVVATSSFRRTTYDISPANRNLFPWLSGLAPAFELYQIMGMVVEYQPRIGQASTLARGVVVLSTQYNVEKPPFETIAQAQNNEMAVACAPHMYCMHAIECDPKQTVGGAEKNVTIALGDTSIEQRLNTWGRLHVCTEGQAASDEGSIIGALWISYEIAFDQPIFDAGLNLSLPQDIHTIGSLNFSASTRPNGYSSSVGPTGGWVRRSTSTLGSNIVVNGTGDTFLMFPDWVKSGFFEMRLSVRPTANWSTSVNFPGADIALVEYNPITGVSTTGSIFGVLCQPSTTGFTSAQLRDTISVGLTLPAQCTVVVYVNNINQRAIGLRFNEWFAGSVTNALYAQIILTQVNGNVFSGFSRSTTLPSNSAETLPMIPHYFDDEKEWDKPERSEFPLKTRLDTSTTIEARLKLNEQQLDGDTIAKLREQYIATKLQERSSRN